ncbi:MAG TPA: DUF255 domain-containing protein [Candidatus Acidoferrum sp.]|nr:DUF255 domain-containing protein [Candidatus Acidoferrum sp.]
MAPQTPQHASRHGKAVAVLVIASLLVGVAAVAAATAADESDAWWKAAREKAGRYPIRTRLVDAAQRPRHVNALILERSPYLLQHAHDPVRWRAWSEDVLAQARRENRLIFLSIGYSSCHWCHVMAREAFDDEDVARLLNARFVSIKVDREEHPDLDERFMKRLALLTGSGGWPANLVLTPGGDVVAGDSYLPPARLTDLLTRFATAWQNRPEQVKRLAATVESPFKPRPPGAAVDAARLREGALVSVRRQYDVTHHGFGIAPKFPNASYLGLVLDAYRRDGGADDRRMFVDTLRTIARSALHDHVAGGFFRYSVAGDWQRPHFEKTLYDQALLVPLFAEAWTLTGERLFAYAAERTLDFVERVMRTPDGLFAGALDADADGRDGGHYLWSAADLDALDPAGRAAVDRSYRRVEQEPGTFLLTPRDGVALEGLGPLAETLRAVRERRPRPFVDAKAITGWNALMIEALARAGHLLGHARHVESAATTMKRLLALNTGAGRVHRYSIDGQGHLGASLEDFGALLRALSVLHEIDGNGLWLTQAALVEKALPAEAALAQQLQAGGHDRDVPSPAAALAEALHRLARQTGPGRYRAALADVATHLRQAVDVDATDQTTLARVLHELDRPAPVRAAFLADGHVRAQITRAAGAGETRELDVTIRIDPGWHVNGHRPLQDSLIATRIDGDGGATVEVTYPPAKDVVLGFAGRPVAVYEGTVTLGVRLAGTSAGVKLSLQACSDRLCLLPETVRLFR